MNKVNKNEKDVRYILDNLRQPDKIECLAVKGENYKEEIFNEIINTDFECLIGEDDNIPICMGGVWSNDSSNPDVGCAWFLSTEEVSKHKISLLKHIRRELKKYDNKYFMMYNYIHDSNIEARKWLEPLGFVFGNIKGIPKRENQTFFYRINQSMKGLN